MTPARKAAIDKEIAAAPYAPSAHRDELARSISKSSLSILWGSGELFDCTHLTDSPHFLNGRGLFSRSPVSVHPSLSVQPYIRNKSVTFYIYGHVVREFHGLYVRMLPHETPHVIPRPPVSSAGGVPSPEPLPGHSPGITGGLPPPSTASRPHEFCHIL